MTKQKADAGESANAPRPGSRQRASLDPAALADLATLSEGESATLDHMVAVFLDGTRRRLGLLSQAVVQGDAQAVMWHAHSLKGGCGIFGARRLAALSQQLEDMACARELAGAAALFAGLEEEFGRVSAELERWRQEEGRNGG